jgi:hypothetical protein
LFRDQGIKATSLQVAKAQVFLQTLVMQIQFGLKTELQTPAHAARLLYTLKFGRKLAGNIIQYTGFRPIYQLLTT